jgi:hypothetical protein
MKWMSAYFVGYLLLMAGVFLGLWKWGILEDLGRTWTAVLVLVALGLGVMVAVANSGRKETVTVESK